MATPTRTLYGVDDAKRVLPLVRSIVRDVVDEFRILRNLGRTRRQLEVEAGRGTDHDDQLRALQNDVTEQSTRIEGYLAELGELGLEVRDLELGMVDFPTIMDGEPAYLSWRLGEATVSFWHAADKGFTDRLPLPAVPAGTVA